MIENPLTKGLAPKMFNEHVITMDVEFFWCFGIMRSVCHPFCFEVLNYMHILVHVICFILRKWWLYHSYCMWLIKILNVYHQHAADRPKSQYIYKLKKCQDIDIYLKHDSYLSLSFRSCYISVKFSRYWISENNWLSLYKSGLGFMRNHRFDLFYIDIINHIKKCQFLAAPDVFWNLYEHISVVTM